MPAVELPNARSGDTECSLRGGCPPHAEVKSRFFTFIIMMFSLKQGVNRVFKKAFVPVLRVLFDGLFLCTVGVVDLGLQLPS